MIPETPGPSRTLALRDLYPQLTETELNEAEERLAQYLALAVRIHERVQTDPECYAQFKALTASPSEPTIRSERSRS